MDLKGDSSSREFTSISKSLLKLSFPTMIGYSIQSLYDVVDMFWIGKFSSAAIAGVVIFSTIFWLVEILNEIIGASSVSMISQAHGKKDYKLTSKVIEQTLVFKFIVALIASAILLIAYKPAVLLFSKESEVVSSALEYGNVRIFFMPFFFLTYSTYTALRNIGEASIPMFTMLAGGIANMFLDPLFMFDIIPGTRIHGLGLGIAGAAWATVISNFIPFLAGLFILHRGVKDVKITIKGLFKMDWEIDKKLILIGLPNGGELLLRNLSYTVMMKIIGTFGTAYISAMGIIERLIGLSLVPLTGFSIGTSALVGHALGKDEESKAKKITLISSLYSLIVALVFNFLMIVFRSKIMSFFTNDIQVIQIGATGMIYSAIGILFVSLSSSFSSAFFGAGANILALLSSIISRWGIMIPYLIVSLYVLKAAPVHIWIGLLLAEIFEAIVAIIFFTKVRWEKKRVV